jgi:hypothetical protein
MMVFEAMVGVLCSRISGQSLLMQPPSRFLLGAVKPSSQMALLEPHPLLSPGQVAVYS